MCPEIYTCKYVYGIKVGQKCNYSKTECLKCQYIPFMTAITIKQNSSSIPKVTCELKHHFIS